MANEHVGWEQVECFMKQYDSLVSKMETLEVFTGCLFLCLVVDLKVKRFELCKK